MHLQFAKVLRLVGLIGASVIATTAAACSSPVECFESGYSQNYSARVGEVSVSVTSDELAINNNTPYPIYHAVFTAEVLPLVFWVPCEDPSACPDLRIESGQELQFDLRFLAEDSEGPLTVFWWHLDEPDTQITVDYSGVQDIEVQLPSRAACA